jgi:4-amino-4-deoxy-L-arabinose transferase-like glycosyltransferase
VEAFRARLRYAIPVLLLALALRLVGIGTESFWVDEAFSAAASEGSALEILEMNAKDTHPPAYYLGLSTWRQVFESGAADPSQQVVVLRGYSVAASLLGILLLMELAAAMAGNRAAAIAGIFAACNPLDIYFANEARMYAQASAISLAGALALWHWTQIARGGGSPSQWWKPAVAFAASGCALLFTHYVGVTLLVAQGLVALVVFVRCRAWSSLLGLAAAALAVALVFTPWLVYVLGFRDTLMHDVGLDWMPVPTFVDYVSFVGREYFFGRAHKLHEQWWMLAALLPVGIIGIAGLRHFGTASRQSVAASLQLVGLVVLPLLLCVIVGALGQGIYYRPRFSVLLLPYFLIGLAMACHHLGSRRVVVGAAGLVAALMVLGTVAQERSPQKRAWRETANHWPVGEAPAFYVVLPVQHQRPLSHYLDGRIRHTPQDVLERLGPLPQGALIWVAAWPDALAPVDAAYREWLKSVGPARRQTLPSYYTLTQVEPTGGNYWPEEARARFRDWYRPFDVRGKIAGFSDARRFGPIAFDSKGEAVRETRDNAWLRLDDVRAGETLIVRVTPPGEGAAPQVRVVRGDSPIASGAVAAAWSYDAIAGEYRVDAPSGDAPLWLGWEPASQEREGLLVHWIGVVSPRLAGVAFRR